MNSVVSGLIETLATAAAAIGPSDWDYIPYGSGGTGSPMWYTYGGGGMGGSGSLCGVPNGCGLVLNMVNLQGSSAQIMYHYEKSEWPGDTPWQVYEANKELWPTGTKITIPVEVPAARVVPDSPLCHVSISKFCAAAGVTLQEKYPTGQIIKNDRCCKIACEMAAVVADIINGSLEDPATYPAYLNYNDSDYVLACSSCHNSGADSVIPAQQGNMECSACHDGDAVIISRRHPRGRM